MESRAAQIKVNNTFDQPGGPSGSSDYLGVDWS